jgi:SAM-dependent methyltransferase
MPTLRRAIRSVVPESAVARYLAWTYAYADYRHTARSSSESKLPGVLDAEAYLTPSNERLADLRRRYTEKPLFNHTFWRHWQNTINLKRFRGDGHYLAQTVGSNLEARYLASTAYAEAIDEWGLLRELGEDGSFGCHTYQFGEGPTTSRDLLDSVLEISYLRSSLDLGRESGIRVLDVGAGYGRFAHRLLRTFPNATLAAVDAVAESTFLCEFYTRYRGVDDRVTTIPADELERLQACQFDVCVNIHSWSECSQESVRFWMRLIRDLRVKYLFVVPHDEGFTSTEASGKKGSFLPEITAAGYKLRRKVHKYSRSASLQTHGVSPAWYCLFEAE